MKKTFTIVMLILIGISSAMISCTSKKTSLKDLVLKDSIYHLKDKQTPFTGQVIEKFSSGKDSLLINIKDGKLDSVYLTYYKNGNVKDSMVYKNGKIIKRKIYLENGKIKKIPQSSLSKNKDGLFCEKNEKNDLVLFNGFAVDSNYHDNDGKGILESEYANGRLEGVMKRYFTNGKLYFIREYKNGKRNGKYIAYYKNGIKRTEGNNVNGVQDGKWLYYKENGQSDGDAVFKNGGKIKKCPCCGKEFDSRYGWDCNDVGYGFQQYWREDDGKYCSKECIFNCVRIFNTRESVDETNGPGGWIVHRGR